MWIMQCRLATESLMNNLVWPLWKREPRQLFCPLMASLPIAMFGVALCLFWSLNCRKVEPIPKWAPCSRQDLSMGFSCCHHSHQVALVMSLGAKSVTAQFHTLFDDHFTTVPNVEGNIDPKHWRNTVQCWSSQFWHKLEEDCAPVLADEWLMPDEAQAWTKKKHHDAVQPTNLDWPWPWSLLLLGASSAPSVLMPAAPSAPPLKPWQSA